MMCNMLRESTRHQNLIYTSYCQANDIENVLVNLNVTLMHHARISKY